MIFVIEILWLHSVGFTTKILLLKNKSLAITFWERMEFIVNQT